MTTSTDKPTDWGDECFYCETCGAAFRARMFDISKDHERTIFFEGDRPPEVEIAESVTIGQFCSQHCRDQARVDILRQENIRATYPGIGPVETCSRCGNPVDMTVFHRTYVEYETEHDWGHFVAEVHNATVVAIVCHRCNKPPGLTVASEKIAAGGDVERTPL